MINHSKLWTDEEIAFLHEVKDLLPSERYARYKERFPQSKRTKAGIQTKASDIGAVSYHAQKKALPLYREREKKGYVQIKVAQPNVYWQKQKWIYLETHPWEYLTMNEDDVFIFLDGDNRNFNPDNIERMTRKEQSVFLHFGGIVRGNPKQTRINLYLARLKLAQLDVGDKLGQTVQYGGGRSFKDDVNRRAREYMKKKRATNPDYRKRVCEYNKKRYHEMKNDQERYEKHKAYHREWERQKRERLKNDNANSQ